MPDVLLLSRFDLERVLDPPSVIGALEAAFRADHLGEWDTPRRITAHTRAGSLLAMPSGGGSSEALGAKLATAFPGNGALGMPSISGLYALFDPGTGVPLAVMDGGYLTLIRTAAVSAVATKLLSRPGAATLGVFGAGAQAHFHVRLLAAVRPIESVVIWARRRQTAAALVASLRSRPELQQVSKWTAAEAPEEAAGCDIVVTATGATEPVLEGRWLTLGTHVNPVGVHTKDTREVDAETVARASVLAIETADTLAEAGDLQMAQAEVGGVLDRVTTLGALLDPGRLQPPRDPEAITLFKSCGVAFEDLALAALAFERASRDEGPGRFDFSRIDSPHTEQGDVSWRDTSG